MTKLTLKKTTLVNGTDATLVTMESYLNLIEDEQKIIDNLTRTGINSTSVNKRVKHHTGNINQLVHLMDKVHKVDE